MHSNVFVFLVRLINKLKICPDSRKTKIIFHPSLNNIMKNIHRNIYVQAFKITNVYSEAQHMEHTLNQKTALIPCKKKKNKKTPPDILLRSHRNTKSKTAFGFCVCADSIVYLYTFGYMGVWCALFFLFNFGLATTLGSFNDVPTDSEQMRFFTIEIPAHKHTYAEMCSPASTFSFVLFVSG